jgi:hypothetical protein
MKGITSKRRDKQMTNKYEWPYGLNENVQVKATKTNVTDLAFILTGFLFIMALPASFALLANGYDLLSLAVFMTGGLAFLSSMAAMLIASDK